MINRKLSKHFIYNWLKEDLFGEFSLYKDVSSSKLTKKILNKVWKNITNFRFNNYAKQITSQIPAAIYSRHFNVTLFKKYNFASASRIKFYNLKLKKKKLNFIKAGPKNFSFYRKTWEKPLGMFRYYKYKLLGDSGFNKYKHKRYLHLNFTTSVYKPRVRLVKKTEYYLLKRYHVLQFFNLTQNKNFFKLYNNSRIRFLSNASIIEFQFSNILVRASFVENGFVAHHLVKRNLFTINGAPVDSGLCAVHPWDIIGVANKSVCYLLYAKFKHFTKKLCVKDFPLFKKRRKTILTRRTRKLINITVRNKIISNQVHRSTFYYIVRRPDFQELVFENIFRTYFFQAPPKYMEISYKLFLCIIFRNAVNSDLNLPYTLENLKRLVSQHSNVPKNRTLFL